MITVIPSAQRHHADHGWLSTHWHFSFSDYYDPKNLNWGDLRVFNDDVVRGGGGFGLHPHRDMEIVTYVVDGKLEHQDHLGNRGVVEPGEVQVMSAGRGIMHAEYNASDTTPVHFMQLWILPRSKGNEPRWEQRKFSPEQRAGTLLPVVSSGNVPGTLAIDQDAVIYVSALKTGEQVAHENKGTHAYLFVIDGAVSINGKPLAKGDQARVAGERTLEITAEKDAELILLDLP
jgi:redox-sensitive bicupin YhaK (pirin superfamily)